MASAQQRLGSVDEALSLLDCRSGLLGVDVNHAVVSAVLDVKEPAEVTGQGQTVRCDLAE